MSNDVNDQSRVERERDFHNRRFSAENRQAQKKFYRAVEDCFSDYDSSVRAAALGADVLEYGCAKGQVSVELAPETRTITGIDISDVAIDQAKELARTRGVSNATFHVMNAEALDLAANSFDFVFGSGIVHHLDVEKSFTEVHRVLRPHGRAIFVEPLGHNPLINWYRARTPEARTPDEHPLLKRDIVTARRIFDDVEIRLYGLLTIISAPMPNGIRRLALPVLRQIDKAALLIPGLRWNAWFAIIHCRKE